MPGRFKLPKKFRVIPAQVMPLKAWADEVNRAAGARLGRLQRSSFNQHRLELLELQNRTSPGVLMEDREEEDFERIREGFAMVFPEATLGQEKVDH